MMMSSTNQPVRTALTEFLKKHNIEDVDGSVDDIVLDYVVSILEDLAQPDTAEDVDVDQFVEMMEAYIPGFGNIDSGKVCDWMFELAGRSTQTGGKENTNKQISLKPSELLKATGVVNIGQEEKQDPPNADPNSVSDAETLRENEEDPQVEILLEMFPNSCALEVTHCLMMSGGDTDTATQLILNRQQSGEAITEGSPQYKDFVERKNVLQPSDDRRIREHMLARYAYIDEHDDKVVHKPIVPKQGPKKMVRYLDGRVVSTKGERFTEVKKEEDAEMKKTYVNLKPARKYRFH